MTDWLSVQLKDKTAVITGASSGIGAAIARRFVAEGARVINLDFTEPGDDATPEAHHIPCDVSDHANVSAAFDQIDCVDVLVNNAGIAHIGRLDSTEPEDFQRIFSVNVAGVYHAMHCAVGKMLQQESGVILNLCCVAGKIGIPDRFAYSMSKGAVLSMTLSVARDYVDKHIRCNCICPGRVHTPFVDNYLSSNYPGREDEMFAKLAASQPIGRMGRPDEIAGLALFLCSDQSAFVTGSAYDIDGGFTLLR